MAGDLAPDDYVRQLSQRMGLDKPVYLQYLIYVGNVMRGNLGRSTKSFRPVSAEILDRYPYTIQLTVAGMLVAAVLGISMGALSAVKRDTLFDYGGMIVALFGVSVPVFWLGLIMILVFAVDLRLLPAGGAGPPLPPALPPPTPCAAAPRHPAPRNPADAQGGLRSGDAPPAPPA